MDGARLACHGWEKWGGAGLVPLMQAQDAVLQLLKAVWACMLVWSGTVLVVPASAGHTVRLRLPGHVSCMQPFL